MRDPNAPVKPASPYFCFLKHVRGDKDLNEEVYQGATEARQQTVLAAAKWKSLSDDEKKVGLCFSLLCLPVVDYCTEGLL